MNVWNKLRRVKYNCDGLWYFLFTNELECCSFVVSKFHCKKTPRQRRTEIMYGFQSDRWCGFRDQRNQIQAKGVNKRSLKLWFKRQWHNAFLFYRRNCRRKVEKIASQDQKQRGREDGRSHLYHSGILRVSLGLVLILSFWGRAVGAPRDFRLSPAFKLTLSCPWHPCSPYLDWFVSASATQDFEILSVGFCTFWFAHLGAK